MQEIEVREENFPVLAKDDPVGRQVLESLSRPVPKHIIKRRQGPGGKWFDYTPWAWTSRVMNETFAAKWSAELVEDRVKELPDLPPAHRDCRALPGGGGLSCNKNHQPRPHQEVVAIVRVSTPWGAVTGIGSNEFFPLNPNASYADGLKGAISLAIVNACHRWGVGLELYEDEIGTEAEEDPAIKDAQGALRSALKKAGIPEATAPAFFSEKIGEDLPTLQDCVDAEGGGIEGHWALINMLNGGSG